MPQNESQDSRPALAEIDVTLSKANQNPMIRLSLAVETSLGVVENDLCLVFAKTWQKANPDTKAPLEGSKVKVYAISCVESLKDQVVKQLMADMGLTEAQAIRAYELTHRAPAKA